MRTQITSVASRPSRALPALRPTFILLMFRSQFPERASVQLKAAPGLLRGLMFRLFVRPVASVEGAPVEHSLNDGVELPVAGGLNAIHVPGHCAGQMAFLWRQQGAC